MAPNGFEAMHIPTNRFYSNSGLQLTMLRHGKRVHKRVQSDIASSTRVRQHTSPVRLAADVTVAAKKVAATATGWKDYILLVGLLAVHAPLSIHKYFLPKVSRFGKVGGTAAIVRYFDVFVHVTRFHTGMLPSDQSQ